MGVNLRVFTDTVRTVRAAAQSAVTGPMPALGDGSAAGALAEVRNVLKEFGDAQSRLAGQVETMQRGQEELLEFVRSVLDDESLAAGGGADHRRRVAVVSLRVTEVHEVVRGLVGRVRLVSSVMAAASALMGLGRPASAQEWPPGPVMRLTTPGGMSASAHAFTSSTADNDVKLAGFSTAQLPAAIAGAIFQPAMRSGKFHGTIPVHTP